MIYIYILLINCISIFGVMAQQRKIELLKYSTAQNLIKDLAGIKNEKYSNELGGDVFQISDGRVIILPFDGGKGKCIVYKNMDQMLDVLDLAKESNVNIFSGVINSSDDILKKKDSVIKELAANMEIDVSKLDKSLASLKIVDRYLKKVGNNKLMEKDTFFQIIVYMGEVINNNYNSKWAIIRSETDFSILEPWLLYKGQMINPFLKIYAEANESSTPVNISSIVEWYFGKGH
jgi:hypothetical protein